MGGEESEVWLWGRGVGEMKGSIRDVGFGTGLAGVCGRDLRWRGDVISQLSSALMYYIYI